MSLEDAESMADVYTDFYSLSWDLRGSESMIYIATLSAIQERTYQRESTYIAKESKCELCRLGSVC